MLKKLAIGGIAAALVFTVIGCNQSKHPGADGYTFGTKQFERDQVNVVVHTYKSREEFVASAKARGIKNADQVAAYSVLRPPFDTCTIHMIDPAVSYDPEFIGHELAHCLYGQWHTDNDSRS